MNNTKDSLRKHGSRATPGRIAILDILKKRKVPMSIAALMEEPSIKTNQTTLYRALESLADSGVVRKVDLGHPHVHYEIIEGVPHHHHIICNSCGKIEDVENCSPEDLEKRVLKISKTFHIIKNHSLEFFGTCKNCVKN